MGFIEQLGIRFTVDGEDRVEAVMPITDAVRQPYGYVHGGATISLLETAASRGSELRCNLDMEVPFGVEVITRHRKSGRVGQLRAVATFDREEVSEYTGYKKQYWLTVAYDDEGDVVSEGTVMCKVVPRARAVDAGDPRK